MLAGYDAEVHNPWASDEVKEHAGQMSGNEGVPTGDVDETHEHILGGTLASASSLARSIHRPFQISLAPHRRSHIRPERGHHAGG